MDEGKAGYDDPLGIYLNTLNFDAHRLVVLPANFDGDGIMPPVQEWTEALVAVYGGRAKERAVRLRADAVSQIAAAGQLPTFEPLLAELWSAFVALVAAAVAAPLESMDEGYHRKRTLPLRDHRVRVEKAIDRLHAVWPAVHSPEPPPLHSEAGWKALRGAANGLAEQARELRAAKFNIYARIFPWFGPAMLAADYDSQNETPAVIENWQRANSEWQQFTRLDPLAGPRDWLAAGVAAGMTLADAKAAPVKQLIEAVELWAIARRAQLPPVATPADLLKADSTPSVTGDGHSFPTFIPIPPGNPGGTPVKSFHVVDSLGERVLIVPANDGCVGDPGPIVLDIEAHTNTRLRDGENPVWFIRLHTDFRDRRDPASDVSFADFCARRHASKVDGAGPPAGTPSNPPAPVDLLTTDELATLAGVGKPRLLTVFSSARTAGESDLPEPAVRGSGSRGDQYSYAAIRAFLSRKWPARAGAGLFPEAVADVKAWLRQQAA